MKKYRIFSLLLAAVMAVSVILVPVLATEADLPVSSGCHSIDAAKTLSAEDKLTETAKAVVLYELNSGTMLYTWKADEKIYPTSMVKMMTALVVLEHANLDEMVTVTRKVLDQLPIGIVSAGLKYGEEISVRDLLYCTMVASANDATIVLANHVAGSTEAFVQMMNDKALEIGCRGTKYNDVNGLHDANTYTTARDIARLTEVALKNELFCTMFQTATYTVPATNKSPERNITTTNHMMNEKNRKYYDERVIGGKTGATDEGGRCLTITAQAGDMKILCVVMGATPTVEEDGTISAHGSFEESKILLDYAFKTFEPRQVFFEGQTLAQYPVANGANAVVTQPRTSAFAILPQELDINQIRWIYRQTEGTVTAPVEQGQKLGIVQAWFGDKCLAQTDMVAMNHVPVEKVPVIPEKPNNGADGSWTVLLVVLGLAVAVGVAMLVVRVVRISQRRKRQMSKRSRRE